MFRSLENHSPDQKLSITSPSSFKPLSVSASAVLVTASTEVDKTGASYYGEQTLHYLAVNGETALVQLREYRVHGDL